MHAAFSHHTCIYQDHRQQATRYPCQSDSIPSVLARTRCLYIVSSFFFFSRHAGVARIHHRPSDNKYPRHSLSSGKLLHNFLQPIAMAKRVGWPFLHPPRWTVLLHIVAWLRSCISSSPDSSSRPSFFLLFFLRVSMRKRKVPQLWISHSRLVSPPQTLLGRLVVPGGCQSPINSVTFGNMVAATRHRLLIRHPPVVTLCNPSMQGREWKYATSIQMPLV